MALGSATTKGKSLDNDYGAGAGSAAPATHQVAIYDGDPTGGGTELTGTAGVTRVSVTNDSTNWPDSTGGVKANGVAFSHPASTAAWTSAGTYVALVDSVSGDIWDYKILPSPINVTDAGQVVLWDVGQIQITT